jgi:hypothetical protein
MFIVGSFINSHPGEFPGRGHVSVSLDDLCVAGIVKVSMEKSGKEKLLVFSELDSAVRAEDLHINVYDSVRN